MIGWDSVAEPIEGWMEPNKIPKDEELCGYIFKRRIEKNS